ncbi:MAG: SoxR reducing system RseC family protein [candidate division WOR-3 bacterium]|nr:MAG: SoxR reducing system RseC family protein [candidate division WOR-3 bacterium]
MRKKGWVVTVSGGLATVCFQAKESCKDCDARRLCHGTDSRHLVVVQNNIGANPEDEVYVVQSAGIAFAASFLLFGLPILLSVIGLLVGSRWHETASLVSGLAGLILGLLIAKLLNNRFARTSVFLAKITEIIAHKGP